MTDRDNEGWATFGKMTAWLLGIAAICGVLYGIGSFIYGLGADSRDYEVRLLEQRAAAAENAMQVYAVQTLALDGVRQKIEGRNVPSVSLEEGVLTVSALNGDYRVSMSVAERGGRLSIGDVAVTDNYGNNLRERLAQAQGESDE